MSGSPWGLGARVLGEPVSKAYSELTPPLPCPQWLECVGLKHSREAGDLPGAGMSLHTGSNGMLCPGAWVSLEVREGEEEAGGTGPRGSELVKQAREPDTEAAGRNTTLP